jgi:hypothetical protein
MTSLCGQPLYLHPVLVLLEKDYRFQRQYSFQACLCLLRLPVYLLGQILWLLAVGFVLARDCLQRQVPAPR